MVTGLETDSVNGSSVALHSELLVAPRSSHRPRVASVRTVVLTSKQEETEKKTTVSDVQESLREDAVSRVVAKKTKQREPLTGFQRQTLIAALVRDLPR